MHQRAEITGHKTVFTEEKVYIKGPANHQCSQVGGNNVMGPFPDGWPIHASLSGLKGLLPNKAAAPFEAFAGNAIAAEFNYHFRG
jgi:hypothetical protein